MSCWHVILLAALWSAGTAAMADAASGMNTEPVRFAVLTTLPDGNTQRMDRLYETMESKDLAFLVQLGPLNAKREACTDELLQARKSALDTLPHAVVSIPDETVWAECPRIGSRQVDPLERLDRVREMLYADDTSLGQLPIALTRQSDQARFRSYRENLRWESGNVMFVVLHLSGNNNNFKSEGGRNREFEDRREANRQWLARAFFLARQQKMAAVVITTHADPDFGNKWESKSEPNLLDGLVTHRRRDGFIEFKRQLRDLTLEFGQPVLLVHTLHDTDNSVGSNALLQDHPLHNRKGKVLREFTRIGVPMGRLWVPITIGADGNASIPGMKQQAPAKRRSPG